MAKVYIRFPKTGLGNMMLVWARGKVFAKVNNLPLATSTWWAFRLGPWIRNEKKKRLYWRYFKETPWISRQLINFYRVFATVIYEPALVRIEKLDVNEPKLFLFNAVSTTDDLFESLREHRGFIKEELYGLLNPSLKKQLFLFDEPVISVHIRRGDFKKGNPITSLRFFIECINNIRIACGGNWPVTVFTDAEEVEIREILLLPEVKLAENKPDILDILLMSRSKVVVLSLSSTFSYWGAFLSEAVIVMSKTDWQKNIRDLDGAKEVRVDINDKADMETLAKMIRHNC
jgi:hypothetical protein